MKKLLMGFCVLLSSCDTIFRGSREPGVPISLITIDQRKAGYFLQRYNFDENAVEDRFKLNPEGTGTLLRGTPVGLQVGLGGNQFYVGLTGQTDQSDRIQIYSGGINPRGEIEAPIFASRSCTIQNFRVNDAETFLVALVSCGEAQDVTQQKLWIRTLSQGGGNVLIENPNPSNQPIAVSDSNPLNRDSGTFAYALTNTQLFFVKNVLGDNSASSLYTLSLNTSPLELPINYIPEKVIAVNTLGTSSLNSDSGAPNIGGLAATRDGVYRIEENGKLGTGKLLPESYKALWSVSTSALKRVALWNPDLGTNFNATLRFISGSSTPIVNTQGQVRDLTFVPVTGNAYYLDRSSVVQVDVSSPPVNNTYRTLSQDYASLGLENPVSIGWILKP